MAHALLCKRGYWHWVGGHMLPVVPQFSGGVSAHFRRRETTHTQRSSLQYATTFGSVEINLSKPHAVVLNVYVLLLLVGQLFFRGVDAGLPTRRAAFFGK